MKKSKLIYGFYRECFYRNMDALLYAGRASKTRTERLLSYLALRNKRLKVLSRILKKDESLARDNPYLVHSLYKCKLPIYLAVNNFPKIGHRKTAYCSRPRMCAYCWVRLACKSFSRTAKRIMHMNGYVYAYHSTIALKPIDASVDDIKSAGLSMFSKRHKYSKDRMAKADMVGMSEQLCAYPSIMGDGSKVIVLELRKLAYCHKDSAFAKDSICTSIRKFSEPSISFCSYPAKIMNSSIKTSLKIDAAFKGSRLLRQYGVMYGGAKSGDVSTGD